MARAAPELQAALADLVHRYQTGAPPTGCDMASLWLATSETCTATVITLRSSPASSTDPDTRGVALVASCMAALRFFPVDVQTRLIRRWAALMVQGNLGATWAAAKRLLGAQTASVRAAASAERAHVAASTPVGTIGKGILRGPTLLGAAASLEGEQDTPARRSARARRNKRPHSPSGDEDPSGGPAPAAAPADTAPSTDGPPPRRRRGRPSKKPSPLQLSPHEAAEATPGAASPTPAPSGLPPLRGPRLSDTSSAMAAPTWLSLRAAGQRLSWRGPDSARSQTGGGHQTLPPLPPPHAGPAAPPPDTAGLARGRRASEPSGSGLPPTWRRSSGGASSSQFYAGSYHPSPDSHHCVPDARLSSATSSMAATVQRLASRTLTTTSQPWAGPDTKLAATRPQLASAAAHSGSAAQGPADAEADPVGSSAAHKQLPPGIDHTRERLSLRSPRPGVYPGPGPAARSLPPLPRHGAAAPNAGERASASPQPRRSSDGQCLSQSYGAAGAGGAALQFRPPAGTAPQCNIQAPMRPCSAVQYEEQQLAWQSLAAQRGPCRPHSRGGAAAEAHPAVVLGGAEDSKRRSNDENVEAALSRDVTAVRAAMLARRGAKAAMQPRPSPQANLGRSLPPLVTDIADPFSFGALAPSAGPARQPAASGDRSAPQPSLADVYGDVGDLSSLSPRTLMETMEASVSQSGSADVCSAAAPTAGAARCGPAPAAGARAPGGRPASTQRLDVWSDSAAGANCAGDALARGGGVAGAPARRLSGEGRGAQRSGGLPDLFPPAACSPSVPAA